jgi:plastocyanin
LFRSFIPALVIALFVVGIGAAAAAENTSSGATVNIEIGDNFFNPRSATVNVGDTVIWTNKGRNPHDVTANNGSFTSPRNLAPGATYSFTVTTAGSFPYVCTVHVNHDGTLVVQAAPAAAPATAPPLASPTATTTAPGAAPRTGGGGMMGVALQPWQQLLALVGLMVGAVALLVTRRVRRVG